MKGNIPHYKHCIQKAVALRLYCQISGEGELLFVHSETVLVIAMITLLLWLSCHSDGLLK